MSELIELPLTSIEVGTDRARDLDPAWIEGLAGSIQEQGLLQPILVRKVGGGHRLVAGHHRLEAFRLLGRDRIPAMLSDADSDDAARLAEIMENLGRYELIALDRCQHLFELKQVWERMYPQAKHGGDRSKIHTVDLASDAPEIFGFARAAAEQIGLSRSAISKAVKIWTGLYPAVRSRLKPSPLADKQTELKALSELPINQQIKVLDLILDEEQPDIGNVAGALAYLDGGVVCDPLEKRFETVSRSIGALDDDLFDSVIAAHEDRVISSLKRRGRL